MREPRGRHTTPSDTQCTRHYTPRVIFFHTHSTEGRRVCPSLPATPSVATKLDVAEQTRPPDPEERKIKCSLECPQSAARFAAVLRYFHILSSVIAKTCPGGKEQTAAAAKRPRVSPSVSMSASDGTLSELGSLIRRLARDGSDPRCQGHQVRAPRGGPGRDGARVCDCVRRRPRRRGPVAAPTGPRVARRRRRRRRVSGARGEAGGLSGLTSSNPPSQPVILSFERRPGLNIAPSDDWRSPRLNPRA